MNNPRVSDHELCNMLTRAISRRVVIFVHEHPTTSARAVVAALMNNLIEAAEHMGATREDVMGALRDSWGGPVNPARPDAADSGEPAQRPGGPEAPG